MSPISLYLLIATICQTIGMWKIFEYENIKPVYSLIPVYNSYKFCSIVKSKVLFWLNLIDSLFLVGCYSAIFVKLFGILYSLGYPEVQVTEEMLKNRAFSGANGLFMSLCLFAILFAFICAIIIKILLCIKIVKYYEKTTLFGIKLFIFYPFVILSLGNELSKNNNFI